jgi:predicted NAD/FAD-dependent oxidoreductase
MKYYDYGIIGGGPTGIALSIILQRYGKSVILLDREDSLGGCHRVKRVNKYGATNLFTEHGPRIYSTAYKSYNQFLSTLNINPNDHYVSYKSQVTAPLVDLVKFFSFKDILKLANCFTKFIFNTNYGSDRSVQSLKLSSSANDYLDKICRLTDGAGADRYTLNSLLQLINQNMLYTITQPKQANDKGIFGIISKIMAKKGINLQLECTVTSIYRNQDNWIINNNKQDVSCKHVIFATPTDAMESILKRSADLGPDSQQVIQSLGEFNRYTLYETYISITLHWNKAISLPQIWGKGIGEWNIAWIVLSDYMKSESPTLISACITRLDVPSRTTGKSAHQSDYQELKQEIVRQLEPIIGNIPKPDYIVVSPDVYYDKGWKTYDNAYMRTPYTGTLSNINPIKSLESQRVHSVGCHNENSTYRFTSIESAIQNAYTWAHVHVPESKKDYKIKSGWTLVHLILSVLILFCIWYFRHIWQGVLGVPALSAGPTGAFFALRTV